jgi:hypothetical protein
MSDLASRITRPDGTAPAEADSAIAPSQEATSVAAAQTDNAGEIPSSSNLQQVDYDVEVSLNQLQQDLDHPLGSAKSFEELGLYVSHEYYHFEMFRS